MSVKFCKEMERFDKVLMESKTAGNTDKFVPVVFAQGRVFINTSYVGGEQSRKKTERDVHLLTGIRPEDQVWGEIVSVYEDQEIFNCKIYGPGSDRTEGSFPNILVEPKDVVWLC